MVWQPTTLPLGPAGWDVDLRADVLFPFDGSVVASAPLGDPAGAAAALNFAVAARAEVAALTHSTRQAILRTVHARVTALASEFEELLISETGKPRVDCRVEVARALATLLGSAEEASRIHGETVPLDASAGGQGLLGFWQRKPIGVVVAISGFNYPLLLAMHKIAPALAAGCPVICKPAPQAPLAAIWLVELFREVLTEYAVTACAVQLVTGDATVGHVLVSDPRIGVVSFTGSSAVGHLIAKQAAPRKVLLELGSNAALIVAPDADLDLAVSAVLRGGYYASGQACISVQRVILHADIRDAFVAALLARMSEVTVGDPRLEQTRVSALIDDASTDRVMAWIAHAVADGAIVLHGGSLEAGILVPTVLDELAEDAIIWHEEVFGPVICLRTVASMDAAFAEANDSRFGLHASVYTRSLNTAMRALDELEVGGVVVNEIPGFRADAMPYGGVKDSGIGREGPRFAVEEYTVTRMAIIRP